MAFPCFYCKTDIFSTPEGHLIDCDCCMTKNEVERSFSWSSSPVPAVNSGPAGGAAVITSSMTTSQALLTAVALGITREVILSVKQHLETIGRHLWKLRVFVAVEGVRGGKFSPLGLPLKVGVPIGNDEYLLAFVSPKNHDQIWFDEQLDCVLICREDLSAVVAMVCLPVESPSDLLYFQIEPDVGLEATRLRAIADLFDELIEEPFFNQLRTKEQLGYTVQSGTCMTYRVLGFYFLVQSSDYDPIYLHERINHFISSLQELLEGLDAESFENYRASLIEQKLEKHPSLIHETDHHWTQIVDKRYLYDMLKLEADELKSIQKDDVIKWYNTYLRSESPKCRRLAIHVWGCNTGVEGEVETQAAYGDAILDLAAFKRSNKFYPSLC